MSLIKEEQNNSPLKLWCSRGPSIYNQDSDGADLLEYDWEGIDTKIESEVFYYEENIENIENIENDNLSNFVRKIFEKIIKGLRVSTLNNIKKNGLEITIEKNVFFITYAPEQEQNWLIEMF